MANYTGNRVVVTGIGALTPLGLDIATTWEGLVAGKSGIDYITQFDASPLETRFAGEVKGFKPTEYMGLKEARRMDRFSQLAVAASVEAIRDAGLEINDTNKGRSSPSSTAACRMAGSGTTPRSKPPG
ncbi:MAG: hypothetical protein H8D49_01235 [Dehalococcoidia bacterium]|nr:hypothetical protein [Dehalococcoidia bacterium]